MRRATILMVMPVDDPPHSGGDIRPWSYRIECLTINLGVMVQKVPKKKHKN